MDLLADRMIRDTKVKTNQTGSDARVISNEVFLLCVEHRVYLVSMSCRDNC